MFRMFAYEPAPQAEHVACTRGTTRNNRRIAWCGTFFRPFDFEQWAVLQVPGLHRVMSALALPNLSSGGEATYNQLGEPFIFAKVFVHQSRGEQPRTSGWSFLNYAACLSPAAGP